MNTVKTTKGIKFIKKVTHDALQYGMRRSMMEDILTKNNVAFLGVVVEVIRNFPNKEFCKKVIGQGLSMGYAEDILGSWVWDATPNFGTLKAALKYYLEFREDLDYTIAPISPRKTGYNIAELY